MTRDRRIFGLETELPILDNGYSASKYTTQEIHHRLPHGVKRAGTNMLNNGGRYYIDNTNLVEYASPETTSALGAVTCQRAGLTIVSEGVSRYNDAYGESYELYYRSMEIGSQLWGQHGNLSADAKRVQVDEEYLYPLAVHRATMGVFSGAGAIHTEYLPNGPEHSFYMEQKAPFLQKDFSPNTEVGDQPIINLRDNDRLSANQELVRIHLTSLNPNWSAWGERMTLGTCGLVMNMIEEGYRGEDLIVDSFASQPLVSLMRAGSLDLERKERFRLGGKVMSAIDAQSALLEHACRSARSDEDLWTIEEWGKVLDDAGHSIEAIADRVGWAAKYIDLRNFAEKHSLNKHSPIELDHPAIKQRDLEWDRVTEGGNPSPLAKALAEKDAPLQADVQKSITTPPQDTRAKVRGEAIDAWTGAYPRQVTWSQYDLDGAPSKDIDDPFDPAGKPKVFPPSEPLSRHWELGV